MKKITALILCVIYTVLLFSGCKKTTENSPAESTEPSAATDSASDTAGPSSDPVITTRPTTPPPETSLTEPIIDPFPQYVQTDINEIVMCRQSLHKPLMSIPFCIPKLLPFSEDAIACQEEIQSYFEPLLEQARQDASEGLSINFAYIEYFVYLNDAILSVVIHERLMYDVSIFHVYNFDVENGKRLDTDTLIEKLQMTDYTERLAQAAKNFFETEHALVENKEEYNKRLEQTISTENLSEAVPYVAENGTVMVVVNIYSTAGAEYYPNAIPIT